MGHDFKLFDRVARELGAACLLRLGAGRGCRPPLARIGGMLVGRGDLLRRGDDRLFRFALGRAGFADPDLALVVGMLQLDDLGIELGRLRLQLRPLGRLLLLPFYCRGEPLLRVGLPLAPLGLFAPRRVGSLPIRSRFARLGRCFCALVGNRGGCRRCAATRSLDILLQGGGVGEAGERLFRRGYG